MIVPVDFGLNFGWFGECCVCGLVFDCVVRWVGWVVTLVVVWSLLFRGFDWRLLAGMVC